MAIITASILLAVSVRNQAILDTQRTARSRVTDLGSRATAAVEGAAARVQLGARVGLRATDISLNGLLVGVAILRTSPQSEPVTAESAGQALPPLADFRGVLDAARDTGDTKVDGELIVTPIYAGSPVSTTDRRQQLRGFFAGLVDARRAVAPGVAVVITTHGRTWTVGRRPHRDPDATVVARAGSDQWAISGWLPRPPLPGAAPAAVAVGLLIAAAIVLVTMRGVRIRRFDEQARAEQARALRLVTHTAAVLEGGVDIGIILPAAIVTLIDELGLESAGVLDADERGQLTDLFAIGAPGCPLPRRTSEIGSVPAEIAGGACTTLPLQTGGRVTGAMWLRTRGALSEPAVHAIRAVSELVQSAIANYRVYEAQMENVRRLEDLDRMKTAFIGTVSHELRTPATAIVGFGSMLEANWDKLTDEQRRDFARRATRNARSLGVLIEDLLDFARLERGNAGIRAQQVDLSQLMLSLLDRLSGVFETHAVETHVEPAVIAMADPTAVERILTNLMSNATKYSPAGAVIRVDLVAREHAAVLTVDDAGSGVPVEERARIFSPFYRMDTEEVRHTRGAGIGLAVVKELVDALGGTIEVGDAPLGGARFEVTFPYAGSGPHQQSAEGAAHVHAT